MTGSRKTLALLGPVLALLVAACAPSSAPAGGPSGQARTATKLKMGWCAATVTSAAAPFFIAKELGWWQEENVEVELVPLGGSTACVQQAATGSIDMSLPSVEPIAIGRQPSKGVKTKIFYTAYQGNIYGIAVPEDSPIRELTDLKGKKIGVTSMESGGVPVARAIVKAAGLNPDSDVTMVVAGEGAETAAQVRNRQIDALSQFDTQYALVENAGVKLRIIKAPEFDAFPSNGFTASDSWLEKNEAGAIGLGRIYAKGTVFAIANPEAAVKIFWKHNPGAKPTGKAEDVALREATNVLNARIANWKLDKANVQKWGENNLTNYGNYLKYLQNQGLISEPVSVEDVVTNQWIDRINNFDPKSIEDTARSWTE